jgi:hypothetical protein
MLGAVLIGIVLLIGDGYELYTKEIPEISEAPTYKFPPIAAPQVSRLVIHGACKVSEDQINPLRTQSCAVSSSAPTFHDRIMAINARMTENDRNRFTNALAEFDKSLTTGQELSYKINAESGRFYTDFHSGSISDDKLAAYEKSFTALEDEGWKYEKSFPQLRSKWQQPFNDQSEYIFGDNPDNLGPNALLNSLSVLKTFVEHWKGQPHNDSSNGPYFLGLANGEFQRSMKLFGDWNQGCFSRMAEVRNSIR